MTHMACVVLIYYVLAITVFLQGPFEDDKCCLFRVGVSQISGS